MVSRKNEFFTEEAEKAKRILAECISAKKLLEWRHEKVREVLDRFRGKLSKILPTEMADTTPFSPERLTQIEARIDNVNVDTTQSEVIAILKEVVQNAADCLNLFYSEERSIKRIRKPLYDQRKTENASSKTVRQGERLPTERSHEEVDPLENICFIEFKVVAMIIEVLVREYIDQAKHQTDDKPSDQLCDRTYDSLGGVVQQYTPSAQEVIRMAVSKAQNNESKVCDLIDLLFDERAGINGNVFAAQLQSFIQKIILETNYHIPSKGVAKKHQETACYAS